MLNSVIVNCLRVWLPASHDFPRHSARASSCLSDGAVETSGNCLAMIQRWTVLTAWLGTSTFASFYPALRVLPVIAKHTVAALVSFGSLHRHRVIIHRSFIWFLAFSVYNHRVVTRSSLSCLAAVNVDTALASFPQPPALTV